MNWFWTICAATFLMSPQALAHDFWLQPKHHQLEEPSFTALAINVGHAEDQSSWAFSPHRIIGLRSIGPDGLTDHQARAEFRKSNGDLNIPFAESGTHILSIETTSAVSVLPPEKFEAYLHEEGLVSIKTHRRLTKQSDMPGKEIYSRRGKAIIQVGGATLEPSAATRPLGLTLEITPMENPYAVEPGQKIDFEIRYRGRPISGVTVKFLSLTDHHQKPATFKSDSQGKISLARPEQGSWVLHAVWSDPLEDKSLADYDTIFSSLSFGFDK